MRKPNLLRRACQPFHEAWCAFSEDDAFTLSASVAFYAALSLAPLLVIVVWISTLLGDDGKSALTDEIVHLAGYQAGASIKSIIDHSQERPVLGSISGMASFFMLIVGATAVFSQLQHALNRIWNVKTNVRRHVHGWLRRRLVAVVMVVVVIAMLLVSVGVSAVLTWAMGGWFATDLAVSILVFSMLFALVFKYMTNARNPWGPVWAGAFFTGVLFAAGKFGIGVYLGRTTIGSPYGAAGSLIVLLVWIYYSALIFFYGAELTRSWTRRPVDDPCKR